MEQIDYSVIIRTTEKAKEKYRALLDSVSGLVPPPREVIVVLPEGYELPEEQLGWESFYFCPKGMVRQRMFGMEICRSQYALFCDDDVSFPPDFVSRLHAPLQEGLARFSAAPLYSFLPDPGKNAFICAWMGSAFPTVFHRKTRYCSVLLSSGYSYNRKLDMRTTRYYETQSAAWTCFYAHIPSLRALEFDKETWLDAHGYSALDDQTMFYKAWLMGLKTIIVSNAAYEHLDGRTSTLNNRPSAVYSATFNRVVFWHRFIYSRLNGLGKIPALLAFSYYLAWVLIRNETLRLRHRMTGENCRLSRKGIRDGRAYLHSEEYASLPAIKKGCVE